MRRVADDLQRSDHRELVERRLAQHRAEGDEHRGRRELASDQLRHADLQHGPLARPEALEEALDRNRADDHQGGEEVGVPALGAIGVPARG